LLRDETWPEAKTIHEKLYGPVEELKRTIPSSQELLSKCSQAIDKKKTALFVLHLLMCITWLSVWQAVLRRRDAIQMEYDMVVEELAKRKDEKEHVSFHVSRSCSILLLLLLLIIIMPFKNTYRCRTGNRLDS
jgi:uncharacterized membrane protein